MSTKSVTESVVVLKMVVVLMKHRSESHGQYCWDILLSQQMFDDSILNCVVYCNCVFQQVSAEVQLAFTTVQLLQWKTLNFLYHSPTTVQSLTPLSMRFSYSSMSMSCK